MHYTLIVLLVPKMCVLKFMVPAKNSERNKLFSELLKITVPHVNAVSCMCQR